MLQIRDNVHGYIMLDGIFADIVNTPEFQRLRSIEQGSFRPVYPGARHDRFTHSLGTYHLATKFVEHFFRNLKADTGVKVSRTRMEELTATFRYAALLHDIGHAPFSHTTEHFFMEPRDAATGLPLIWTQLCEAVRQAADPAAYQRFAQSPAAVGSPHEIVSAILLVTNFDQFSRRHPKEGAQIDLELAARMVIGYPYTATGVNPPATPAQIEDLGIRNCLISLLNCKVLDVDRLDYLGRDTQMSGFVNAPLDLDCLARSVTAVRTEDGWLTPAYRDSALSVFDTMFQAKLSHDTWVLANPMGPYESALQDHCIRQLCRRNPGYISRIFSVEALSQNGVCFGGKRYYLLNDVDVAADLKALDDPEIPELYTRVLGVRRSPAWKSHYEFYHIFEDPHSKTTAEGVYHFFKPLMEYLKKEQIFAYTPAIHQDIKNSITDPLITGPADFLDGFLMKEYQKKQEKKAADEAEAPADEKEAYSVVLLDRSGKLTKYIQPDKILIVFSGKNVPLRENSKNYSTYADLAGITPSKAERKYFYLFRRGGLGKRQLADLRKGLATAIKNAAKISTP